MGDKHLPALDGARGLAALAVLISHLANSGYLPGQLGAGFGRMAVALFFVLSGFLMWHLYGEQALNRSTARDYLLRRIGRILPLYFVVLLFSIQPWPFWTFDVASTDRLVLSALLIYSFDVLWTIPVEFQFYLLFIGIWALRPGWLGFALLAAIGIALGVVSHRAGHDLTLPVWLHFFLFGVIAARCFRDFGRPPDWFGWTVMLAFPLALPQVRRELGLLGPFDAYPWSDPILIVYPLLFFASALYESGPFSLLRRPPLRWLGSISFGVYLLHRFVQENAVLLGAPSSSIAKAFVAVLIVASTLGLAHLSLNLFERPAQRWILAQGRKAGMAPTAQGN